MRKFKAWGLGAALVLGLGTAAARAADDDTDAPAAQTPRPFIRWSPYAARMFRVDPSAPTAKQPPKKPALPTKPEARKPAAPAKPAPARPAGSNALQDQTVLLRRLAVCDKLKEIGLRNNDEALLHQAEQLEARAWAAYQQRAGSAAASTAGEPALEAAGRPSSAATLSGLGAPARPHPGKVGDIAAVKEVDQ